MAVARTIGYRVMGAFVLLLTLLVAQALFGKAAMASDHSSSSQTGETYEINSVAELADKRLGIVAGTIYGTVVADAVEGVEADEFSTFDTMSDAIAALKARRIDAVIDGRATSEHTAAMNDDVGVMPAVIAPESIGICLQKDSPLTKMFNARLAAYREDGTLKKTHDKWIGANLGPKTILASKAMAPKGDLHVAYTDTDPMCYTGAGGKVLGYEAEVITSIAYDLGYSVKFERMQFSQLIPAVQNGQVDAAVGNITITEGRRRLVDMTTPDDEGGVVAIVRTKRILTPEGVFGRIENSFYKTFVQESRWRLIVEGFRVTLTIAFVSAALALLLGHGLMLMRHSGMRWAELFVRGYQAIVGGVPIVVVLMVLYYVVFGSLGIAGELVAILAFMLSYGAKTSAIMWAAIEEVDKDQEECALAMGYTPRDAFKKVVLSQASEQFLPKLVSLFESLIKETAVVGYIAIQDLTRASDFIRSRTMEAFFPLVATAIIYFVVCSLLTFVLSRLVSRHLAASRPRRIKGITT